MHRGNYRSSNQPYGASNRPRGRARSPSPPIKYGTPVAPALNISVSKSSRHQQYNERFHGAFTGGFSAGYYNSVGSKDGWTPQEGFVSNRENRVDFSQKRTDVTAYMDDEDWNDQELTALRNRRPGAAADSEDRNQILELFTANSQNESFNKMSEELMTNLGWYKYNQGVVDSQFDISRYKLISSNGKVNNTYGLGFGNTENSIGLPQAPSKRFKASGLSFNRLSKSAGSKLLTKVQPSFGNGPSDSSEDDNDDSDDDEDSCPAIKISSSGNLKRKPALIGHKFIKRKVMPARSIALVNKNQKLRCLDGNLPLDGFIIASVGIDLSTLVHYFDPRAILTKIPTEPWVPKLNFTVSLKYDDKDHITKSLFNDASLPKKSVFDYLTPDQREKIVQLTGNISLPQGKSEALKYVSSSSSLPLATDNDILIYPTITVSEATAALANPRLPYVNDEAKRSRYLKYLKSQQSAPSLKKSDSLNSIPHGLNKKQWEFELTEFSKTAKLFGSQTGLMNQKFVSAKHQTPPHRVENDIDTNYDNDEVILYSSGVPSSTKDSTGADAVVPGKYGELKRSVTTWRPDPLLAKRLGILWVGDVKPQDDDDGTENNEVDKGINDPIYGLSSDADLFTHQHSSLESKRLEDLKPEFNAILEREPEAKSLFESIFGQEDDHDAIVKNDGDDSDGW